MPTDEQTSVATAATTAQDKSTTNTPADAAADTSASENVTSEAVVEQDRSEKILKAKELYSHGSRNFLVKSYAEAADELSQVCALYEELHGELSDELGMPYLLYGKSLIALALDENKVIDVPDEEEEDDDEDEEDEEPEAVSTNGDKAETNGTKLATIKESDAADSTDVVSSEDIKKKESPKSEDTPMETEEKTPEDSQVSSTEDEKTTSEEKSKATNGEKTNGSSNNVDSSVVNDGEKPSTSNGEAGEDAAAEDEEENEAASNLQLAWEILELAAKIFTRQGERGHSNLAEVHTELGNIEFENNLLEAARGDYEKALTIYKTLPSNYRRAMAEIHYKIGLSYLMQQSNKEGATSLKEACKLIADEIEEMKSKPDPTEKDKNNIQDMEETKQEIEAKIIEIEETQAQNVAEVRAALDSYIKPLSSGDVDAGTSKSADAATASTAPSSSSSACGNGSSSAIIASSSKPTDISHLIKRKKPEDITSEAEAVTCSPAKRPAV